MQGTNEKNVVDLRGERDLPLCMLKLAPTGKNLYAFAEAKTRECPCFAKTELSLKQIFLLANETKLKYSEIWLVNSLIFGQLACFDASYSVRCSC